MSTKTSLTQATFDRVLARALTLDEEGRERIDLARARAIARELGVSDEAWAAAVREWEIEAAASATSVAPADAPPPLPWPSPVPVRLRIIALVGVAVGALGGSLASDIGNGVLVLGGAAVVAGVAIVLEGMRRRSLRETQQNLSAWWLALPAGIVLGFGGVHPDPIILSAVAWGGSAALAAALDRLRRRLAASAREVTPVP